MSSTTSDRTSRRNASRVLVIEDDAAQAMLIERQLTSSKREEFRVENAETLESALQRLKSGGIDALLVDLGLPDSDGLATFDAVRAAATTIPTIVLTGNDDEETAVEAVRRGAQDYIIKRDVSGPMIQRSVRYALERKRLEEQLLTSKKMEAVGLLAGGIAHEFNNLLQTIQGFTRFAMEGLEKGADDHHYLSHVLQAANRAAVLVRQLLDFGHGQAVDKRTINLREFLDNVVRALHPIMGDDINVEVDLADGDTNINGDPALLKQMLMNLCTNSRNAMPAGGRLTIRSRAIDVDENDFESLGIDRQGPFAVVSVVDTGSGIPADVQEHIFEPFFTTRPVGQGTGLGLALAYSIVQQHEGVIRILSEEGQGTTADVYLPIVASPTRSRPGVHAEKQTDGQPKFSYV